MPAQRAQVPDSSCRRSSAIEKLTGGITECESGQEPESVDGSTILPQGGRATEPVPSADPVS
jgi:hypothetical protein